MSDGGEQAVDYQAKLLDLFHKLNISNIWSRVKNGEDFDFSRIGKGTQSATFRCDLKNYEQLQNEANQACLIANTKQYRSILVKFYEIDAFIEIDPLELSVVNTVICQSGLGPNLIYTDAKCAVYEYVEGTNYNYHHECQRNMRQQTAQLLARFHCLNVPVSNTLQQKICELFLDFSQLHFGQILIEKTYLPLLEQDPQLKHKYYDTLAQIDMPKIFSQLIPFIRQISHNMPMVFSHNDFNRHNRLVRQSDQRIIVIDFDFCSYNYRGYDFGRYFSNYLHQDDMFGWEPDNEFPNDEQMDEFLEDYRREVASIRQDPGYLEHPNNCLKQLRRESKIFTLQAYAIDVNFGLFMFTIDPNGQKGLYFLEAAYNRWLGLQRLWTRFIEEENILE